MSISVFTTTSWRAAVRFLRSSGVGNLNEMMNSENRSTKVLILGIGNVLMGDEGIGVHVVNTVERAALPRGVDCLDGGTGSFLLLEPMQNAEKVILIDATIDGSPPGTIR